MAIDENREVLDALSAERAAGRACVLATVIATTGSAPREPGAKMLVRADGTIAGTVGGGPLEGMAIVTGKELLASGAPPTRETFELKHQGPTSLKMRCGGTVEIFFDVHRPPAGVVIFGGGHVGRATAAVCVAAGVPTTVVDDREEFSDPARFPGARVLHVDLKRPAPFEGVTVNPGDAIVIVTRCHDVDEGVLRAAIATKAAAYIGMIGSKRKVTEIFRRLAEEGVDVTDPRLHAPIGLALGGDAPGEIAVSIVAEVLKVRSARDGTHLRDSLPAAKKKSKKSA